MAGGRARWDANVDTSGATLRTGGQHVSDLQISRKHAVAERIILGRITHGKRNKAGLTLQHTRFDTPVRFEGLAIGKTSALSIDGSFKARKVHTHGEATLLRLKNRKAFAAVAGFSAGKDFEVFSVIRHIGPQFFSPRAAPFAAYGGFPRNERGLFLGARWRIGPRTRLLAEIDRHRRLRSGDPASVPGRGSRFRLSLDQRGNLTRSEVRLAFTRSTRHVRGALSLRSRRQIRLKTRWGSDPWRLDLWGEAIRAGEGDRKGRAVAGGTTLDYRRQGFRVACSSAAHRITDSLANVYAFEPAVWGGAGITTLSNTGLRTTFLIVVGSEAFKLTGRLRYRFGRDRGRLGWACQLEVLP